VLKQKLDKREKCINLAKEYGVGHATISEKIERILL
jgi:hypothetical protein